MNEPLTCPLGHTAKTWQINPSENILLLMWGGPNQTHAGSVQLECCAVCGVVWCERVREAMRLMEKAGQRGIPSSSRRTNPSHDQRPTPSTV